MYYVFAFHNKIPDSELEELLTAVNPDVVLIELAPESVAKREFTDSPREMVQALTWAEANRKHAFGFDCPAQTKPDNYSPEAKRKVSADFQAFDRKYSWRDGNREDVAHELAVILIPFTDPAKMSRRQHCMLQQIRSNLPAKGKAVIITGAYHSDFFRSNSPGAQYPVEMSVN